MDINALQVFNCLHALGITDDEFKAIGDEVSHKERTGLSIKCVKKGCAICVSHDMRHNIVIKKFKTKRDLRNMRILFKTLILFEDLPDEIYVLHQIAQYRSQDNEIKDISKNLEELKDRICDRYADGYPKTLGVAESDLDDDEEYGYHTWAYSKERTKDEEKNEINRGELTEKQLKAIFWLFGEDYNTFELKETRERIPKIIKVFSRNNRRIALFQETLNHNYNVMFRGERHVEGEVIKIKTYTPRDERYNYACPNREVYIEDNNEIWVDDDLLGKIGKEEFKILNQKMFGDDEGEDGSFIILNSDKYNQLQSAISLELMSVKRNNMEEKAKRKLVKSIETQFKNGKVVRQGIEFTKTSMSYNGLVFKADRLGEFLFEHHIIIQEQPQFTKIFNDYINWFLDIQITHNRSNYEISSKYSDFKGDVKLNIGNIKLRVYKNRNTLFVQINGKKPHRITKEDINEVLQKSMEYANPDNIDGYEEYLSHTSIVNLKLQKALEKKGLEFVLEIDKTEDNILSSDYERREKEIRLVLPLFRRKNKNYTLINGKEHKIKNINALYDLGKEVDETHISWRGGYLQRTIRLLYRAVNGINPKDIGDLILQGKKNFSVWIAEIEKEKKEKVERSMEFLANAIRLTKATKVKSGYIVRGLTENLYFVDLDKGGVWIVKKKGEKYVNDKYLCIVDKNYGEEEWQVNDRIANRLLALSKDSVVASEIWSNGDRMDTHWRDVLEIQQYNRGFR